MMNHSILRVFCRPAAAILLALAILAPASTRAADAPKPIRALLLTGGCCHDYKMQKDIIPKGIDARANVEWTVVQDPSNGTTGTKVLYPSVDWAKGFDVVVHNECFADDKDPEWVERILKPHRDGVPAVVVHCAMHCYRAPTNEWFKFCGVTSHKHGSHFDYDLKNAKPEHPIMKGFPATWRTPKEELYHIAEVWPGTISLGTGYSPETKKDETCIWVSQYGKARVFGTTVGHYNETMEQKEFMDVLARGLLWACDKLDDNGQPKPGYGPKAAKP